MDIDTIVREHNQLKSHLPMLERLKSLVESHREAEERTVHVEASVTPDMTAFLEEAKAILAQIKESATGLDEAKAEFQRMSAEMAESLKFLPKEADTPTDDLSQDEAKT